MSNFNGKRCDNCGVKELDNFRGWWVLFETKDGSIEVVPFLATSLDWGTERTDITNEHDACGPQCVCEKFQKLINKKVNDGIQKPGGQGGAEVVSVLAEPTDNAGIQGEPEPIESDSTGNGG